MDEYQMNTRRTEPSLGLDMLPYLINYSMGMSGESGEVVDQVKKVAYQGHTLDEEELAYELGDVLYYVARFADWLGYSLSDIAAMNEYKLQKRYPNGFSEEDSRNRKF